LSQSKSATAATHAAALTVGDRATENVWPPGFSGVQQLYTRNFFAVGFGCQAHVTLSAQVKKNSFETVLKLFRNSFETVLFRFRFNCADSFRGLVALCAQFGALYSVFSCFAYINSGDPPIDK